jgi:hypothetical protein
MGFGSYQSGTSEGNEAKSNNSASGQGGEFQGNQNNTGGRAGNGGSNSPAAKLATSLGNPTQRVVEPASNRSGTNFPTVIAGQDTPKVITPIEVAPTAGVVQSGRLPGEETSAEEQATLAVLAGGRIAGEETIAEEREALTGLEKETRNKLKDSKEAQAGKLIGGMVFPIVGGIFGQMIGANIAASKDPYMQGLQANLSDLDVEENGLVESPGRTQVRTTDGSLVNLGSGGGVFTSNGLIPNSASAQGSQYQGNGDGEGSTTNNSGGGADSGNTMVTSELEFQQQRYNDWKAVFGDVQTNLSNFYTGLRPEQVAAQGIQAHELEMARAKKNLRENLTQRGLQSSGLAVDSEQQLALESASERARIRTDAPFKVAEEQSRFLQIGLGQDPSNSVAAALSNSQSRSDTAAAARAEASGTNLATIGKIGVGLADIFSDDISEWF